MSAAEDLRGFDPRPLSQRPGLAPGAARMPLFLKEDAVARMRREIAAGRSLRDTARLLLAGGDVREIQGATPLDLGPHATAFDIGKAVLASLATARKGRSADLDAPGVHGGLSLLLADSLETDDSHQARVARAQRKGRQVSPSIYVSNPGGQDRLARVHLWTFVRILQVGAPERVQRKILGLPGPHAYSRLVERLAGETGAASPARLPQVQELLADLFVSERDDGLHHSRDRLADGWKGSLTIDLAFTLLREMNLAWSLRRMSAREILAAMPDDLRPVRIGQDEIREALPAGVRHGHDLRPLGQRIGLAPGDGAHP
jgi:hypothetical protein